MNNKEKRIEIQEQRQVIVAPLNWGLGHASRCIPMIQALLQNNFTPIIASDGKAFEFLQKEFPQLIFLELPSYGISYAKNLKWRLFLQLPKIFSVVKKEKKVIARFLEKNKDVVGIISDNRFGVRNSKISSVYITHQLNVLSGITTFFTSKIHQSIIKKFDECWIPDTADSEFSGKLSSLKKSKINTQFIGVLSRFEKQDIPKTIDVLILLSGPEPHRTTLENKLIKVFENYVGTIVLVQGKIAEKPLKTIKNNISMYNYALSNTLEKLMNASKVVVCRSGYSSVMDLAVLDKKVFFIPTKHQTEQEYLAKYFSEKGLVPFATVEDFTQDDFQKLKSYTGLSTSKKEINSALFRFFHGK